MSKAAQEFRTQWFKDNPPTFENGGFVTNGTHQLGFVSQTWEVRCMVDFAKSCLPEKKDITKHLYPIACAHNDCIDETLKNIEG